MLVYDLNPKNALKRQPAQPVQINKTDGTLPWGQGDPSNAFPLQLATLVQESPAASACISILADFLEGNGFSDDTLSGKPINALGQTFGDLHNLICESYALFEGFTILVKYTSGGKISELFHVPFENVRLTPPDSAGNISKVRINPYYGTPLFRFQDSVSYDVFNPDPKIVMAQQAKEGTKYKGQVLYVAFTRPLSRFYPMPYYYSAKYWMDIDAQIGKFHSGNLDAGFFQTVLLKMVGDPDAPSTHPDDQEKDTSGNLQPIRTKGQRFEIDMQSFVGADSKTKMLVLWEQMKDQLPELQAFPSLPNDAFFQTLQAITTKNILISMKIPSILANMGGDTSLSDGNQMANATRVMHDRVAKSQNLLERTYKQLLPLFTTPFLGEVKIVNTNSFETLKAIDPLIWAEMSVKDRQDWITKNTDYPVTGPPAPAVSNKFVNVLFTDYPEKAKQNAATALKFMADHPECGKPMGRRVSQDIVDGKPLSFKDIRRLYNYLKRNQIHENKVFSDSCDAVMFSAWGGSSMLNYCAEKINFIND